MEYKQSKKSEYDKSDYFLYHLKLPYVKRTAMGLVAYSVCRNLENIFKKSDPPAYKDYCRQPPFAYLVFRFKL